MAIVAVMLAVYEGCTPKEAVVSVPPIASFDLIQDHILTPTCATSACHASEQTSTCAQHGLVLAKGKAYEYLVNKDPKNANARTDKLKLVTPYFSLQSLFYHKLVWGENANHHGGLSYGNPMPLNGKALYKGQIEFVRRWIEAGAPRTGSIVDTTLLNDKTPSF